MNKFDRAARRLDRLARKHPPEAEQVGALAVVLVASMKPEERERFIAIATTAGEPVDYVGKHRVEVGAA
jgi:hypothetical protein